MPTKWTTVPGWNQDHSSGPIEESISYDGQNSASVRLRGPWSSRHAVTAELLGVALNWPYVPIGAIASRIGIKPVQDGAFTTDADGLIQYEEAIVEVFFSVNEAGRLDQATDPTSGEKVLFTESLEPTIEYTSLDHKEFRWGDANGRVLNEHEAPSRRRRGMNLIRSIFGMPAISSAALDLIGKTNDTAYVSATLGLEFPAETLLWIPPTSQRSVTLNSLLSSDVQRGWNFVFKWNFKKAGHNKEWNSAKSGGADYDVIWDTVTEQVFKQFPPADMSAFLF